MVSVAVGKTRPATEAVKYKPQPVVHRLGSAVVIFRCSLSSVVNDDRDITCAKSVLRCEDQKIGILIFCAGCCRLATQDSCMEDTPVDRSSSPLCD
jgi:hypothetical protein